MSRHDEISKLITLENGKPLKEAQGEVNYSADYLLLYAEEAKRIHVRIKPMKANLIKLKLKLTENGMNYFFL